MGDRWMILIRFREGGEFWYLDTPDYISALLCP